MDPMIDQLRERLAAIATRDALEAEQADLRERVKAAFSEHPDGRIMLEEELTVLERRLSELEGQQIKKAKISMGGGSPSGGGLEPQDVYYLRKVHEKWNDVPALRERIEELRARLNL